MKRLMLLAAGALVAGSVLADNTAATGTVAKDTPATVTSAGTELDLKAELKVGTDVKDHEVVGEASSFGAGTDKVVAWTRVTGATQPTQVFHVWKKDGQEVSKVTLNVQSASYRTYSRKSVTAGKWTVEVQDNNGKVLASKDFTVEAGEAPAAPAAAPATEAPAKSAPASNAAPAGGASTGGK